MTFPEDPLGLRTELQIGGVWTDITGRTYTRDRITTSQGMSAEGTTCDPSTCNLLLKNSDGALSPRNPMGPWYGQLGRNIPLRVSVPLGESYLDLDGSSTGIASTPDANALDITADIDLRAEITADWAVSGVRNVIGKWNPATNQRSYMLFLEAGLLGIRWSTDGIVNYLSSRVLPPLPARAAVRATLDVDNGAGGCTVRFYTAPSLSGPWAQFDESVITSIGTTNIFSSTSPLAIAPSSLTISPPWLPMTGRVHRAEVRSGIGGSVVAAPDFRALATGATSHVDTAGRTWTLAGTAVIDDREFLFSGEMSKSPPRWATSNRDVRVPVEAAGILRRLGQGRKALDSTLRRRIPSAPSLIAYWPMEEDREATQLYSPVEGVAPLRVSGFEFAADDTLAGSSPLPKLKNPATLSGGVPRSGVAGWQVEMVYLLPSLPVAQTEILRVDVGGSTIRSAHVYASTAGIRVEARNADGDVIAFILFSNASALAAFHGSWNRLSIHVSDAGGGTTNLVATWRDVNGVAGRSWAFTIYTGTLGYVSGVSGAWGAATEGMALGHLGVMAIAGSGTAPGSTYYDGADDGYNGETAGARILRLCGEEGISAALRGSPTLTARMGPQRPATLLDLLVECSDADIGILMEHPRRLGLFYRTRKSLENQAPLLVLDYAAKHVATPLEPTDDDKTTRNDITVTRAGGSSSRAIVESGPLSVLAPEAGGVGQYDQALTMSLYDDSQPAQIANWLAHLGTWDEARYPSVRVRLHRHPELIPAVLKAQIGDNIRIINAPDFVQPGPIDLQIRRIAHSPLPRAWEVTFDCLPAGPWNVAVVGQSKADTAGCVLNGSMSSSSGIANVLTAVGPRWVDSATYPSDFPFDVLVGGEVMTVTSCSGTALSQTFGVTRAVNGVVKAHPSGTPVSLARPAVVAL
ncbi:hypothetical protein [Streptomyces sp. IB2014 016-6]|uniref:hypothetical protein n=1 Tax=Streptomyces sp. IB2014 016-6 TaxID=2517818 RepID=UPI0011CC68C2|nr:hypothetical protein [Streptomyces sp. IB2014 016-6]TXL91576.1 hypothetical protein EW053_04415 [Streptomyces sp. IB2014 016-6]